MAMRKRVVFLDRDDVVNKGRHHPSGDARNYVTKWEEFEWIAGSKEAIIRLLENDYFVAVVSNQACIGKGIVEHGDIRTIHNMMLDELYVATRLLPADKPKLLQGYLVGNLQFYICPHTEGDQCSCRKPAPGMLLAAAYEYNIHLPSAWMVGNQQSDIAAGLRAGVKNLIRIDASQGMLNSHIPANSLLNHGVIIPNLLHAVNYILEQDGVETEDHLEVIWCPECRTVQVASVEHTAPFFTHIHECTQCKYMILESEWNQTTTGEAPVEEDIRGC